MNIYERINPCKNKQTYNTFQDRWRDENAQCGRRYGFLDINMFSIGTIENGGVG